jgi:hypothetical protein
VEKKATVSAAAAIQGGGKALSVFPAEVKGRGPELISQSFEFKVSSFKFAART